MTSWDEEPFPSALSVTLSPWVCSADWEGNLRGNGAFLRAKHSPRKLDPPMQIFTPELRSSYLGNNPRTVGW